MHKKNQSVCDWDKIHKFDTYNRDHRNDRSDMTEVIQVIFLANTTQHNKLYIATPKPHAFDSERLLFLFTYLSLKTYSILTTIKSVLSSILTPQRHYTPSKDNITTVQ